MTPKRKTGLWKEQHAQLWEKMLSTYLSLKNSPSAKLVLKFIALILRITLSIVVRKIFLHFFPNF